jgi:hypothetical protein
MRALLPLTAGLVLLVAACDLAGPIEQQSEASKKAAEANELRDNIQQPVDRAKAAGDPVIEADKRREQELKDAGG